MEKSFKTHLQKTTIEAAALVCRQRGQARRKGVGKGWALNSLLGDRDTSKKKRPGKERDFIKRGAQFGDMSPSGGYQFGSAIAEYFGGAEEKYQQRKRPLKACWDDLSRFFGEEKSREG